MGREVRRVPIDWQHPTEWRERWDRHAGTARMQLVHRPLFPDYPGGLEYWGREAEELARREGFDWTFWSEYCLTGYKGRDDAEACIHPFETSDGDGAQLVDVRDANHLHKLLTERHERERPNPKNYMPVFAEGTAVGWCMYENTSEGSPISPVFSDPDTLAHWLADNGASAFGSMTASYEEWREMVLAGWAPSAVDAGDGLKSGVAAVAKGV